MHSKEINVCLLIHILRRIYFTTVNNLSVSKKLQIKLDLCKRPINFFCSKAFIFIYNARRKPIHSCLFSNTLNLVIAKKLGILIVSRKLARSPNYYSARGTSRRTHFNWKQKTRAFIMSRTKIIPR